MKAQERVPGNERSLDEAREYLGAGSPGCSRPQVKLIVSVLALAVFVQLAIVWALAAMGGDGNPTPARSTVAVGELAERTYEQALAEYKLRGYEPARGVQLTIPATWFVRSSGEGVEIRREGSSDPGETGDNSSSFGDRSRGIGSDVWWTREESWIEWDVDVTVSGLYNIAAEYLPIPGKRAPIQRDLEIDGAHPFVEAKRIMLERIWRDSDPPKQDNQGNDVRPRQVEAPMWRVKAFEEADGLYGSPLLFYLSKGRHRLRMSAITEPVALRSIRIFSPPEVKTYQEVLEEHKSKGYREVDPSKVAVVKVQAEDIWLKSDPTLRREYGPDPMDDPPAEGKFRLNEFGHWRWRKGGQFAIWKVDVPEDGLYKIGFKLNQDWVDFPVIRSLLIDGKPPFKEAELLSFPYAKHWRIDFVSGKTVPTFGTGASLGTAASGSREPSAGAKTPGWDEPFLFYLTKGEHTLTLTVKVGPAARSVHAFGEVVREMGRLSQQIVQVTGPDPDPDRDWELEAWIPDLKRRLLEMAKKLEGEVAYLTTVANKRPRMGNSILMIVAQLRNMASKPDTIPIRLNELSSSQSTIGFWMRELQNQPLTMDYIVVAPPAAPVPDVRSTFWQRLKVAIGVLVGSFRKEYTGIGNVYGGAGSGKTLTVWVARGREWAEIIKEMTEDDFTPSTGIRVNMNIIPTGDMRPLLLAAVAGKAPDLALGVNANLPVEFAIRNALVDLSQFEDYGEVAKRFRPGALIPYEYRKGDYALPETQDFTMLFYRTDILGALGLSQPRTWQEVYDMLPRLHENGLDFYYGAGSVMSVGAEGIAAGFTPFLFQHGGDFYAPGGLRSALTSPEALAAFKEWTGLYTSYKIQRQADFFNRMRTGEMPIGVSNYWTYMLLSVAAPELTGWWRMEPIPGIQRADGTIDRTTGGSAQTAIMFSQSEAKDEAWEFMKWWTSADVQERFGTELEALLGVEARWNTANVEALRRLPWPQKDIAAILEQWQWFKEVPVVLGGYFTSRHVMNAWNRAVLQGKNPREVLEDAVTDIDRELEKKQEEFGVTREEAD